MLNQKHIEGLIELINQSPFFQHLSMVIEDMGIGYSLVRINMNENHLSPYGAIQGGVYSSIIDTAAYWAPYAELTEDVGLISLDVNVHNLSSIRSGKILARGERIKVGKTLCLSEVIVTNEKGSILAQGSSKLLVTQGLQTIPQMVGYSLDKIPPKFI
ncbi:MAG: PaaI family thioesterase [Chitinophagales bacterium]